MSLSFSPQLIGLPTEILDNIAFHVACSPLQIGPPGSLLNLLLTCREVNEKLAGKNNVDLYARMFKSRFDWRAVRRRAFDPESLGYYEQLVHYSRTLRVIRSGRIHDVDFLKPRPNGKGMGVWFGEEGDPDDDLDIESLVTTAYLMLLENDGWNVAQLDYAGTYEWVEKLLRTRLYEGSQHRGGWPLENRWSSCALWVFWTLTTQERLRNETEAQGDEMVDLVFPIAQVQFKVCNTISSQFFFLSDPGSQYPTSYAPPHHFHLPLTALPPSVSDDDSPENIDPPQLQQQIAADADDLFLPSLPSFLPIHSPPALIVPYFGRRLPISAPVASPAAKLIYFSRRELWKVQVPPNMPTNRADARARAAALLSATAAAGVAVTPGPGQRVDDGSKGPTAEDVREWNGEGPWVDKRFLGGSLLPLRGDPRKEDEEYSKLYDTTFNRLRVCTNRWGYSKSRSRSRSRSVSPEDEGNDVVMREERENRPGSRSSLPVSSESPSLVRDSPSRSTDLSRSASPTAVSPSHTATFRPTPRSPSRRSRGRERVRRRMSGRWRTLDQGHGGALRIRVGPVYVPGSLTGLWVGRMTVSVLAHFS